LNTKLRAIIVDDERLARADLRSMLADMENVDIVGEAANISSAAELIGRENPDLVFLDIQMPGESGFDLLEKVELQAQVVFVTAFDEYAIRAFEVNAVDYLLKPVNPERLRTALERVSRREAASTGDGHDLHYDDALLLTFNTHRKFVRINSIICIQSAADYTELITSDGKKGLVRKTMSEWEERLPREYFCRIHRTAIVNIDFVETIDKKDGDSYEIRLKGVAAPLPVSRRYAGLLRQRKR
jgi:two-component system LytT family response regulator